MITIGLIGPSGAGKSACGKIFESLGFFHIDADRVYKKLCAQCLPLKNAVFAEFPEAKSPTGEIDFAVLSRSVFRTPEKLRLLGEITHPFVLAEIRSVIRRKSTENRAAEDISRDTNNTDNTASPCDTRWKGAVIDAAALIESGFAPECDIVAAVYCDKETRVRRIISRDGISEEKARMRVDSQPPDEFYFENSDIVIENNDNAPSTSIDKSSLSGAVPFLTEGVKKAVALAEEKHKARPERL